ncbi:MAG: exonuclease SbcCD subunit D [Lachnospiraceae bacterium]
MRFIHLADLHIGKKVNEVSMIEDQRFVLEQVMEVAKTERIDGILLAGDIYDKMVPSAEAVQLLDWFLTAISDMGLPVYMVSGNHDSGERLAFGAELLKRSNVYVAAVYDGRLEPVVLEDEYGSVNIYLLPFVKPAHVKKALRMLQAKEEETAHEQKAESEDLGKNLETIERIETYQQAVEMVLEGVDINPQERNILVAHQLVTGALRCDSEDLSIGGIDNIDASVFEAFDYVALGHIHGPQSMTRETIRYAGTLLKYSFSECSHKKSITIVDFGKKGDIEIKSVPVKPLHDMRQIKGEYNQLMARDFYKDCNRTDYLKVTLTDEEEIPDALGRLRTVYPNIMKMEYDNARTKHSEIIESPEMVERKSPLAYFEDFYRIQNNQTLNENQRQFVENLIESIWEGKV